MGRPIADALYLAVESFAEAPTKAMRDQLMVAADDYREGWIAAQARQRSSGSPRKGSRGGTSYDRKLEVERTVDGIPVRLALQERTSPSEPDPWWVASWRTKYKPGGSNRRFYVTADGCWTIPADVALEMIEELGGLGAFEEDFYDRRRRPDFNTLVSTEMSAADLEAALESVTGPDEDWGESPFLVINTDPHEAWKKVLIVNSDTGEATFRSITTKADYMPKKVLRPNAGWWLDNSMMDANVQQMLQFQKHLTGHISRR